MRTLFLPPDRDMLLKQAMLYRRLAAVARSAEAAVRLGTLADRCQAEADMLEGQVLG